MLSSLVLFYLGVLFTYFLVLPLVFGFFTGAAPEGVLIMTDISRYLDFVLSMMFAFSFAFEIPIFIFLLIWSGISSSESLRSKRPYVIIGCFTWINEFVQLLKRNNSYGYESRMLAYLDSLEELGNEELRDKIEKNEMLSMEIISFVFLTSDDRIYPVLLKFRPFFSDFYMIF